MMNNHRPSAVLPEASQIAALLEDVMAFDDRMSPSDDPTSTAVIRGTPRSSPPPTAVPIGLTTSELFKHANWTNQPLARPRSRSVEDTVEAKPIASHTLSKLLGFVNWSNAADAPRRSQAASPATGERSVEFTVNGIMDNFRWD